jgi:hypothetical protein
METGIITALVSAASVVAGAGLTYYLTKRREQELEWRKLKLEHYKSFMSALSCVVGSRTNTENQSKYADAVNTLQLVAPEQVLVALYNFQREISRANASKTVISHDAALTRLLRAIRADVHPSLGREHTINFRLLDTIPNDNVD